MEISSSPKHTIPNDVIVEILSWAPANSLWRFQWACKYWFDLIRDPEFIKLHLLRHSTTTSVASTTHEDHYRIIDNTSFLMPTRTQIVYSMRCMDILNQTSSSKTVKMDYYSLHPLSDSLIELEILGSCNGLIYFYRYSSRIHWNFLWNPSTTELKELPAPIHRCVQPDIIVHGFGYDHIINDYKVVRVTYYHNYNEVELIHGDDYHSFNWMEFYTSKAIDVYTLGSNLWSTIKIDSLDSNEYGKCRILDKSGVYLNGILHWMKLSLEPELLTVTLFDIAKEKNREIQLPNTVSRYLCSSDHRLLYLSVLDESLCIFHMNDYDKGLVDIWMMKVYSIKESWTKLFTIDMKPLRKDFVHRLLFYINPLMYRSKDGGIVMVVGGNHIVAYDPKKNKARYDHNIEDCPYKGGCVVASYTGSLVSLNSGKYLTAAGSITTITAQTQEKSEKRIDEEDTKMKKQESWLPTPK